VGASRRGGASRGGVGASRRGGASRGGVGASRRGGASRGGVARRAARWRLARRVSASRGGLAPRAAGWRLARRGGASRGGVAPRAAGWRLARRGWAPRAAGWRVARRGGVANVDPGIEGGVPRGRAPLKRRVSSLPALSRRTRHSNVRASPPAPRLATRPGSSPPAPDPLHPPRTHSTDAAVDVRRRGPVASLPPRRHRPVAPLPPRRHRPVAPLPPRRHRPPARVSYSANGRSNSVDSTICVCERVTPGWSRMRSSADSRCDVSRARTWSIALASPATV